MKRIALLFFSSLLAFGQQPTPAAKATIEGTVTRAGSGQPLKNARVTLRRVNNNAAQARGGLAGLNGQNNQQALGNLLNNLGNAAPASVTTDAGGHFIITGVDPGDYRITAEREGFIRSEFGQRTATGNGVALKVASNQRVTANLQMTSASVISGRVITPDGDPSLNTNVQAYTYQYQNGQRTLNQVGNAQTNDLGEYRLFGLEPGEYFVSVSSPELAPDQTPVGTLDLSARTNAPRNAIGIGLDAGNVIEALAGVLGDRGGRLAEALGGGAGNNPPVYYPSTLDPDAASSIAVAAGVEVRGVDFNLRPSRAATVSGKLVAPFALGNAPATPPNFSRGGQQGRGGGGGRANIPDEIRQQINLATGVQINLSRVGSARSGFGGLLGRLGATPVKPDGSFELKGVAPGTYNLTASTRDPNGQEYTARTRITVGNADVNNVNVSLRAGAEIQGRITVDSTASQQFKMSNLRVSLVAEDTGLAGIINIVAGGAGAGGRGGNAQGRGGGGGQIATATVAEDGSFTLKDVGALEYRVRVTGLPQGAYILSGRLGSTDALNGPINVDNSTAVLQLQLGFTPGKVSGVVTDTSGAPAPGSQVVLVPDEARRGRTDAYFSTNSDQNGQYNLNNVPPGNYKVFAWEDIPNGAYQYPDFLRRYEDRGQAINVNPNGTITANPRLIPAT